MTKKSFCKWIRKLENLPDTYDINTLESGDFVHIVSIEGKKTLGRIFENTDGFSIIKMVRISRPWDNYSLQKLEDPNYSWLCKVNENSGIPKAGSYFLKKLTKKELDKYNLS